MEKRRLKLKDLNTIPMEVYQMEELEILDLSGNFIKEISPDIKKLKKLKQLNLSSNNLRKFPNEILELSNLEQLILSHNEIRKIPPTISKLSKLEMFSISSNPITKLPFTLGAIESLKELRIDSLEIKNIPPEIIKSKEGGLINFLKSSAASELTKLFEAKLLIVGEGAVGKTSFLKKLHNSEYKLKKEETTEGIIIKKLKFEYTNKKIDINAWDFGGQEIYHSTHQFFLSKRALYIFIWSARQDDDNKGFDYWLNTIKLLGKDSPVIVVQSKTDERIKEINEDLLKSNFPNIISFNKISLKNNNGIDSLVASIKKEINKLEHIGDGIPKEWVDIRKKLENSGKNYISLKVYLEICSTFGLDEEKALFLSGYYHDLGTFLHFSETPVLDDIIFLKPEWATSAVYKLIDTEEIVKNLGKFSYSELKDFLNEYPIDTHSSLLALMEKFELCFKLEEEGSNYILPELMNFAPLNIPWETNDNITFKYKYKFLPKGILTRFIVRNNSYIDNSQFWRNAVILSFKDTYAKITINSTENEIVISTFGENKLVFLKTICKSINQINETLRNPDYINYISCNCSHCNILEEKDKFFYEYETLKRYLNNNLKEIRCDKSLKEIEISTLLQDVYVVKEEVYIKEKQKGEQIIINNNIYSENNNTNNSNNDFIINIEIKNEIASMQGEVEFFSEIFNKVTKETKDNEDIKCAKEEILLLKEKLSNFEKYNLKNEIIKGGVLRKIGYSIENIGKIVSILNNSVTLIKSFSEIQAFFNKISSSFLS